jgi:hypothetical protein
VTITDAPPAVVPNTKSGQPKLPLNEAPLRGGGAKGKGRLILHAKVDEVYTFDGVSGTCACSHILYETFIQVSEIKHRKVKISAAWRVEAG